MLVEVSKNIAEVTVSNGSQFLTLKAGEKIQLYGDLLMRLLREGIVCKTDYPEIANNEIVVVKHSNDHGWKPIGQKVKR